MAGLAGPSTLFNQGGGSFSPGTGVGDPGEYDGQGGRTTAGLSPDLRSKVQAMMKANPNLRINSGLRDKYTQQKLGRKGMGRFAAGGMSPHSGGWAADIGPASQYGWMLQNAGRFGLQTASAHGEPWHVQRTGTITPWRRPGGKSGIGEPTDPPLPPGTLEADVDGGGFWGKVTEPFRSAWDTASNVGPFGAIKDTFGAVMKLVEMFSKVFKKALDAADLARNAASLMDIRGLEGASGVAEMGKRFMSLVTGGISGETKGLTGLLGGPDIVLGYNEEFAKGLPSGRNVSLYNLTPQYMENQHGGGGSFAGGSSGGGGGGGFGARGASAADINSVYTKYAGGVVPTTHKSVDAATRARMVTVLEAAQGTGLQGDELIAAVSLAGRESDFNPRAFNGNLGTKDLSYGLWQINMLGTMGEARRKSLGISSNEELFDPQINAKAMKQLYDASKTPFYHWGPYKGQAPLYGGAEKWVEPVYNVAKMEGFVGDPGDQYGGGTTHNNTFNNTFKIELSSNGHGGMAVDVKRLVPMIADKLEEEMDRRMVARR
jgi:hypothetical protein